MMTTLSWSGTFFQNQAVSMSRSYELFFYICLQGRVRVRSSPKCWQHLPWVSQKRFSWKVFLSSSIFVRFLWLFVLLYIFQSQIREKKCCDKIFLQAYKLIYESTDNRFENVVEIIKWFSNTFFKTFLEKESVDARKE